MERASTPGQGEKGTHHGREADIAQHLKIDGGVRRQFRRKGQSSNEKFS